MFSRVTTSNAGCAGVGRLLRQNTWVADVSGVKGAKDLAEMTGLRVDGRRAIRAKYRTLDQMFPAKVFLEG